MPLTRRSFLGLLGLASRRRRAPRAPPRHREADSPTGTAPRRQFGHHRGVAQLHRLGRPHARRSRRPCRRRGPTSPIMPSVGSELLRQRWGVPQGPGRGVDGRGALRRMAPRKPSYVSEGLRPPRREHEIPFTGTDKEKALQMLQAQMKRLKTDYIDLWMIHGDPGCRRRLPPGRRGTGGHGRGEEERHGPLRVGFTGHTSPQAMSA